MIKPLKRKRLRKRGVCRSAPAERTAHRLEGGFGERMQKVALEPER